jgi:3-dehydroquinate dehydratase-2
MKILILNGPNLNQLGTREPHIYGSQTLDQIVAEVRAKFAGHTLDHVQSNHEGALIDAIQQAGKNYDAIVINAGAYSHTSYALYDALRGIAIPVVEVHISNVYAREPFRQTMLLSPACKGVITGLGAKGYELAVRYLTAS